MKKIGIGLMSGTSLDGIDVLIAEIEGYDTETKVKPLYFQTYEFESALSLKIKKAMHPNESSSELLCSLNFELGHVFADAVLKALDDAFISLDQIDYIASHGQTIYHISKEDEHHILSSLQLGEGAVICNRLNKTVISNFRAADIACGGQGAPLVPFADYVLFKDDKKNRAIHNIGGISNLTVLKKQATKKDVFAFDTGPGNMMINDAMTILYGLSMDQDGKIASKGELNEALINELLADDYFHQKPPKSTGRERYGFQKTSFLINKYQHVPKEDLIQTFTYFTAKTIAFAYQIHVLPQIKIDEIIICGGGVHNQHLLKMIQDELPKIKIMKLDDLGFNSDSKEALAFLILGHHTLAQRPSNIKNATGAKKDAILGQINYAINP
jgi:anhydro-N-acetylmuramic acid kinase